MCEEESVWWCGLSGCASVMCVDDILEVFDGDFSASDFKECPDDCPDHVSEESVSGDGENGIAV